MKLTEGKNKVNTKWYKYSDEVWSGEKNNILTYSIVCGSILLGGIKEYMLYTTNPNRFIGVYDSLQIAMENAI